MINLRQEITAGNTLVREAIQSQNFVSGTAGWQVKANGDAEFNNLTARGEVIIGNPNANHLELNTDNPDGAPGVNFFTGATTESLPGYINTSGPGSTTALSLQIFAPQHELATLESAYILIQSVDPAINPDESAIELHAKDILAGGVIDLSGELTWTNLPLAGTWTDVAGQRAHYRKDAAGTVWVEGLVSGGAAVTVGTLPAGYRPSQTREVLLRGGNPGPAMVALRIQTNGDLVILTNLASAQARLPIDFSFTSLA